MLDSSQPLGNRTVIGIDLGGTKISSALFDESGKLSDRRLGYVEGRKATKVGREIQNTFIHLIMFQETPTPKND